jgi:hypothetical protein
VVEFLQPLFRPLMRDRVIERGGEEPFLLVGLNSPLAKGLMIVIWSLALLGILFKLTIAQT